MCRPTRCSAAAHKGPRRLILLAILLLLAGCGTRNSRLDHAADLLVHHRPIQARAEIAAAIRADPTRSETYREAAAIYYGQKMPADAARVLQRLLDQARMGKLDERPTGDERAEILVALGQARRDSHDLSGAESAFREALSLSPRDPQFLNALAWFYADNDLNLPESLRLAEQAAALAPEDGAIVDTLGWAEYKLGRNSDAIRTLRRAVKLMPDRAELRYHLGAAYARQGLREEARVELNKALILDRGMNDAAKLIHELH